MKIKIFLASVLALCATSIFSQDLKAYATSDVNQDGSVSVSDVTVVAEQIVNNYDYTKQMVKLEDVAAILTELRNDIKLIKEKLGISDSGQNTGNVIGGHEYVDLGLPSGKLWATCNIGAESPEDVGGLFAWGETAPKNSFEWSNYKFYDGEKITKYFVDQEFLDPEDDAAYVNWGGEWRMPNYLEYWELIHGCDWSIYTQNNIDGIMGTSKENGNTIFIPANIVYVDWNGDVAKICNYWTNTYGKNTSSPQDYKGAVWFQAYGDGRDVTHISPISAADRCSGFPVRPVYTPSN